MNPQLHDVPQCIPLVLHGHFSYTGTSLTLTVQNATVLPTELIDNNNRMKMLAYIHAQ